MYLTLKPKVSTDQPAMISAEENIVEEVEEVPEYSQAPNEPNAEPEVQDETPDEQGEEERKTTEVNVVEKTASEPEGQQLPCVVSLKYIV